MNTSAIELNQCKTPGDISAEFRGKAEVQVKIAGVAKFYGEHKVLTDVKLDILRGECVVLCGPSGSGKSTLLRAIAGLELVDAGEILVRGRARNTPQGSFLDQGKVGLVFQGDQLYPHMTVLENIIFAPLHLRRAERVALVTEANRLLEMVGLQDTASRFPHELSGGQQQRVAIIRCLAQQPDVLLMDEPTSALDPSNVKQILSIIYRLREEGLTIVLVTHETGLARMVADRIVCMEDGLVREAGVPQQMVLDPSSTVVRNLFGDTIHEISALDRILHTRILNVGAFSMGLLENPSVQRQVCKVTATLGCRLQTKLLSHRRPELDLRMGNIDLLVAIQDDYLNTRGLKHYPQSNDVNEASEGCSFYVNSLDSAWQRQFEKLL